MPPDGIVALDNGMYKIWFARNYRTPMSNTLLLDNALATMGAGLPSAMMAAITYPGRRVLAVCGDGGFMMNSQELETAVRLGLNLVVLILQDNAYGMIRWKQAVDKFDDWGMTFGNPDFVSYAQSYGAQGSLVKRLRISSPSWSRRSSVVACSSWSYLSTTRRTPRFWSTNSKTASQPRRRCSRYGNQSGGAGRDGCRGALRDLKTAHDREPSAGRPGPGEVLVQIKAAGLCHSDLSVINGNRPRPLPMALGHEASGIVEEVGPPEAGLESDLKPGDHVVFVFVPSCGHCEPCTEGRPALCEPGATANGAGTLLSGARRLHRADGSPTSTTTWVSRDSQTTQRCRGDHWSRSIRTCHWWKRLYSAAQSSPGWERSSTPLTCPPARRRQ